MGSGSLTTRKFDPQTGALTVSTSRTVRRFRVGDSYENNRIKNHRVRVLGFLGEPESCEYLSTLAEGAGSKPVPMTIHSFMWNYNVPREAPQKEPKPQKQEGSREPRPVTTEVTTLLSQIVHLLKEQNERLAQCECHLGVLREALGTPPKA